jgi:hypothetical protein
MSNNNSFAGINFDDPSTPKIFKKHEDTMCPSWKDSNMKNIICDTDVKKVDSDNIKIQGNVYKPLENLANEKTIYMKYWAANPVVFNDSYSGSGLPFQNEFQAFDNNVNRGKIKIVDGSFTFYLKTPNSYYLNMGTFLVGPEVKIQAFDENNKAVSDIQIISLGNSIPFRTLTWPQKRDWNKGPLFYVNKEMPLIRTQYQILMDSAYPSDGKTPDNFWGKKPPM